MDDLPPSSERPKRPLLHPWTVRGLIALAILGVLGLIYLGGAETYKKVRHQRAVERARGFLEKKDYAQAALSLQWALQIKPGDIEATRLLAEAADGAGARDAVQLRRAISGLEPKVPENYIAWANSALQNGDSTNARMALDAMRDAGLENAAYHDARARLANISGKSSDIEPAMAEAVRLDPNNPLFRLRLASTQIASPQTEVREQARVTIEELAKEPTTRRPALRVLLYAALASRDGPKAIAAAEQLRRAPEATFPDRLVYLGIMRKAARWEFWWDLADLQAQPALDPEELTEVLRWLVRNNLAKVAVDWGQRLPNERRLRPPVAIALAEAYTILRDWDGLRPIVKVGEWGELDFQRRALLARVMREQGDAAGSRAQWSSAVTGAGDRPEPQATLMTLTKMWNWEDERVALLWVIARGRNAPKPALDELLRRYLAEGQTRELLAVFSRLLELDPKDPELKNNVAYASLLLNQDKKHAETLAAEAYNTDPKNPGFAASYGYALYIMGKYEDGLKITRTIAEKDLQVPSNALSHALLLAATGEKDTALKYLAQAEKGRLLPEEKGLLAVARQKAGRP
jgi:Tfp pilus assembly protein PilF